MRIEGLVINLLMVKIVTTGHISTWDHIKSVLSLSRKKQTRKKRFLYTQLRETIHLPYPPCADLPDSGYRTTGTHRSVQVTTVRIPSCERGPRHGRYWR